MEVRLPEVRKLSVAAASSSSCVMITLCVIQEDLWQCAELSYGVSSMSACCGRGGRIFNLEEKQKMFPSPHSSYSNLSPCSTIVTLQRIVQIT